MRTIEKNVLGPLKIFPFKNSIEAITVLFVSLM